MKLYEMMVIFPLDDGKFNEGLTAMKSIFSELSIEVKDEKLFADRELCYEILGQNKGRYYLFTLKANPSVLTDLDHKVKLSLLNRSLMLRYMIIKLNDKVA